jgi:class 3 adenylate cyclase/predicted ATPase
LKKPLGITTGRHGSTIFKLPLTRARGLNLEIDGWLRGIGLEQYAQTFRDNAIDADVLCDLTDEHLRELGLPLGARLKLLRAVAALSTGQTPVSPQITTPAPRADAERRQVTVMLSDLVGSTALSARMDPEDLRDVISAYQKCVTEIVRRFGGFVANYMGDGVLAYFGYPQAHEDDADRAVRAGLELVAAVRDLKTHAILQTRVGIATGLVVVGDLIGSGSTQEQAVVGETPNLAARLQGLAEPNSVVIAESTRKLVGNLFEVDDLGAQNLKGIEAPVRVWAALRPSSVESRFDALHAGALTELVGRQEELELLLRRWSKAKTGEGQVVLLSGEPGIGKSRLTAALIERLVNEPRTRLGYFCSPQHTDSAFYPIISQMERAAGFGHDDTAQAKLDKIDALLAQTLTRRQDAALLAEMLSLPNDGRYPTLELSPQQRRQKTLEALAAQVEALSRSNPVLLIFEDVHWVDPTSLEVLGRTVDRLEALPVLLIVTYRPEFEPPWLESSFVTALNLTRLGEREIAAMIDSVIGNKSLSESVRQDIVERTDGIPLFVEEMTRAVLEAESEGEARWTAAAVSSSSSAVPATLYASLMARLDRLGPAKEVAQIGAAIGREFSYALLRAVVGRTDNNLRSALVQLEEAKLVFRHAEPPEVYTFKHALVQDAAYESLLKSRRQVLHRHIAEALRDRFPAFAATEPEVVAHHFTRAGHSEDAGEWWRKAGERALHSYSYNEAIAHLRKGVDLAEGLNDGPAHWLLRLRLQTIYGQACFHAQGLASPEATAAFARARELARRVEDPIEKYAAFFGLWAGSWVRADLTSMREVAEASLSDARRFPGSPVACIAHRMFGTNLWYEGDYARARSHYEQALAAYDHERDHHLASRFSYDVGIVVMLYLGTTLWPLGEVARACRAQNDALALAVQSGHVPTVTLVHATMCHQAAVRRKPDQAALHAETLLGLASKHVLPAMVAFGRFYLGWSRASRGDREGEPEMREGLAAIREMDIRTSMPFYSSLLAEVEAKTGRIDTGLATIDAQLETIEQTGERWFQSELYRLRGEFLLERDPPNAAQAEVAFACAINIAREQKARTFELRAAVSLAKLYQATGRGEASRDLLVQTTVGFDEGPEVPEVAEGNHLLKLACGRREGTVG